MRVETILTVVMASPRAVSGRAGSVVARAQAERFPEDRRGGLLVPHRAGGLRLGQQVLEARRVHRDVPVDGVAGIACDDDLGAEQLAQLETALCSDASAVRGASAPQRSSTSRSTATVSPARSARSASNALPAAGES